MKRALFILVPLLLLGCGMIVQIPDYKFRDINMDGTWFHADVITKEKLKENQMDYIADKAIEMGIEKKGITMRASLDFFIEGQDRSDNGPGPYAIAKTKEKNTGTDVMIVHP